MQTSAKKACFQFAECSFSSAKKMQTSAKKACFQFAECSFSSAKIRLFLVTSKVLGKKYLKRGRRKKIGGSRIGGEPPIENYYFLRCFKKSSIPTISTFGKGMFSNSLKCLSSVTIKIALLVMAQSTNLLSSSSAFINPKL